MRPWGILLIIALLLILSCKQADKTSAEIAKINLDMQVFRFDRDFAQAGVGDLPSLKAQYPFLFPAQYPDSVWRAKMQDSVQIELLEEVDMVFMDFDDEEANIEQLLRHIIYYFPTTVIPDIITLTTDVDYNNRVILADSLLLIGLDNYLGKDHRYYRGIDRYIAQDLDKKYLLSDVASAYANSIVKYPTERSFLARMVYYGKLLYLKDQWMPLATDGEKIHYTSDQLTWAEANEEQIWRYFIDRELLFSTDQGLDPRFLEPAPFSKFRLELDNESPGRLGRYMGWRIVRSFMENNDIPLQNMLTVSAEEIFKNSNYKPNK